MSSRKQRARWTLRRTRTDPSEARDELPLIDGYHLVRRIGKGGMGEVYEARNSLSNRVAIKILSVAYQDRSDLVRRFQREVETLLKLHQADEFDNFVAVLDHGTSRDGRPFVVMELLRGETLDDLLKTRPNGLDLPDAVGFVLDICFGLHVAHGAGVVHRDLNLRNLFVVRMPRTDHCKVLDFGIAKSRTSDTTDSVTAAQEVWGTPDFMAPERLQGETAPDDRIDIYAAGVVLYWLLAGRSPFPDMDKRAAIVAGRWQPLARARPELPPEIVATVHRALAQDPDQRQQTIRQFFEEVRSFARQPVRSLPASPQITGYTLPERRPAAEPATPASAVRVRSKHPLVTLLLIATAGASLAAFALATDFAEEPVTAITAATPALSALNRSPSILTLRTTDVPLSHPTLAPVTSVEAPTAPSFPSTVAAAVRHAARRPTPSSAPPAGEPPALPASSSASAVVHSLGSSNTPPVLDPPPATPPSVPSNSPSEPSSKSQAPARARGRALDRKLPDPNQP